METKDINTLLFRCSSLGKLMPGKREGKEIAQGTLTHLVDCFVSWKYSRKEEVDSKVLEKGNLREEDSITLVSLVHKKFYKKNSTRLSNQFITGEWDLDIGEPIEETLDTKTSWSAHTFFRAKQKGLEEDYEWQGHGYMWLTGAKKHSVCYCLVNGTAQSINDEKRKLAWKYAPDPETNPDYIKRCKQIEINHIFDLFSFKEENPGFDFHNDLSEWKYDIPMKDRLKVFTFNRDEEKIKQIEERVIRCREWIKNNLMNEDKA